MVRESGALAPDYVLGKVALRLPPLPAARAGFPGQLRPRAARGVRLRDQVGQLRPVVTRRMGRRPGADQAMTSVDDNVVLVAEGWRRDVDARRPVVGRLRLGELHRPAGIAILLRELGRLVFPGLGNPAGSDVSLLAIDVALLGRGHNRGVDDLTAHGPPMARNPARVSAAS